MEKDARLKTYPMVEKKIQEAFDLALRIDGEGSGQWEKDKLMSLLKEIAMYAIDGVRNDLNEMMHYTCQKYSHHNH